VEIDYKIGTGNLSCYYTLWEVRKYSGVYGEYILYKFIKNLSKYKIRAMVNYLGVTGMKPIPGDFLKLPYTVNFIEAFGEKLKRRIVKGRVSYYGRTTKEFRKAWKENKIEMKMDGWSCYKSKMDGNWYMAIWIKE